MILMVFSLPIYCKILYNWIVEHETEFEFKKEADLAYKKKTRASRDTTQAEIGPDHIQG
jgi:hypothetical protein